MCVNLNKDPTNKHCFYVLLLSAILVCMYTVTINSVFHLVEFPNDDRDVVEEYSASLRYS